MSIALQDGYLSRCRGNRYKEAGDELIDVSTILSIRQRCANEDSVAIIAGDEGVSESTVRKCREMTTFRPSFPLERSVGSCSACISR